MVSANARPVDVLPVGVEEGAQSLNGDWSFKYIPSLDTEADRGFYEPGFDVTAWKQIPVPANWELHGFAEPQYALNLKEGLGLYRRAFRVPATWREGRRVCLRFEGVAYGFVAWVNGTKIGASSASCYNPHTFDVTDALHADVGVDNVLAVQVTTKPLGWEFDVNDDWALSGIYRDVTLFSVPTTHVQDVSTRTKLTAEGAAELMVSVKVSQSGGEVRGRLLAPDGKMVSEFNLSPQTNDRFTAAVKVPQPQLWTAETPSLYHLQLTLSAKGQPLQTIAERIGLREVSIADGVLQLNGRPIKLRGVNHHDLSPVHGRAITEAEMRQDLALMRQANINFIRTSHYPPHPRFIELCDELGFYVMDEVSIGKGEEHLNKASHRENILARVAPTITRDMNRPSVIIWSIGNENPLTEVELEACRRAKELDPSRPVCLPKIGSYFERNHASIPGFVDIHAPHYPVNATLRRFARDLQRPTILTEYAHALGLATDRIQDQWEIIQQSPVLAGGAIWHFHDQGIIRTTIKPVDRNQPTEYVWLDSTRFYDTHGNDGCDGIVYSDRTPQTDFWQTRKVYSPVRILERAAPVTPGNQELALTVENRHDFRALAGMRLKWSLQRNGATLQQGEAPLRTPPRKRQTVGIPVVIPADADSDVLVLSVRCVDERGLQITERVVRLDLTRANRAAWLATLPPTGRPDLSENADEVRISLRDWTLTVARATGKLSIRDRSGRELVAGIYPHPGRKLTMTEGRSAGRNNTWRHSLLSEVVAPEINISRLGDSVQLAVSGTYPRPQAGPEKETKRSAEPLDQMDLPVEHQVSQGESFVGGYRAEIAPRGVITIRYDYAPTNAKGKFSEAGLSVVLPAEATEFRWIGQGPYAGYPGKDALNEFGLFHLHRDDLHFQGNRRETELALLTTPAGAGLALATTPCDVAVERAGATTLLSHNAVISGLGNKGSSPEVFIDASKPPRIAGSFTLVLLTTNWPTPLTRWFGPPAAATNVFRPFYHSYDQ